MCWILLSTLFTHLAFSDLYWWIFPHQYREFSYSLYPSSVPRYGYSIIYLPSSLLMDISNFLLLQTMHMSVGSLGRSVWSFVILLHIIKLPSTEDLYCWKLYQALHSLSIYKSQVLELAQSMLSTLGISSNLMDKKYYFITIVLWISIILSDAAYLLLCLGLSVFPLFIFKLSLIPFYCFPTAFLVFS